MPALRPPELGPIVGHVSDTCCRVWIRGSDTDDKGAELHSERRTLGVTAIFEVAKADEKLLQNDEGRRTLRDRLAKQHENGIAKARETKDLSGLPQLYYFRLHREYDRTGTFLFGTENCLTGPAAPPLKATTAYLVLMGVLVLDDPFSDDRSVKNARLAQKLPDPRVWAGDLLDMAEPNCLASFKTLASAQAKAGPLHFILGSCRYPGILWKAKEADKIFGPLNREALGIGKRDGKAAAAVPSDPAQFVLMVGDQIYADMMNRHVPIGLADTFEEFQERYHTAFGSRNMRRLLRQVPTYMILDDHEIEDNWTQDRLSKAASRKVFHLAIGAYMSYQWSHCPRNYQTRLYYHFEGNGYPFFVLDTRTQRFMDDVQGSLDDNHLLGRPTIGGEEPSQLDRLLRWLVAQQQQHGNVPKFIVTSSVFAPSPISAREGRAGSPEQQVKWKEDSDSWPAFPTTRKAVLGTIIKNGVQNVVFLSGDIHCANVCEISFAGSPAAEQLKCFSITSSAFYWPFPFADGEPSSFVHDSRAEEQRDTFMIDAQHSMDYRAWNFTQEDNFCRVDLDPTKHKLTVAAMNDDGEIIRRRNWLGQATGKPVVSELQLAPW